ncbi:MATE family efflux transporter [Barnesiella propionica]|uniref:MATE family efflux transporter n=1 Tax=Barnesiella propionica TaxID=2981781 RepID=UPI0011C77AFF|nr:MATE family efflux transporter [Barnesiella propionica]MCU6770020.1 MATE family efflux transporter [Barnesiella propionica]
MSDTNSPLILGTKPIGKLLLQYSIPAIIAMTVTSLYNIIDSIFIGHGVGPLGITGLAVTFPLMNLVIAFCTLVAIGGATISSIYLGQKDFVRATEVLENVLILCIITAFCFGGLTLLFLDPILIFFGASRETLPYAHDFMEVILIGSPISYVFIGLNNIMRATGYPRKAMLSSLLTVGANIILAPIFIFHFDWGIKGAAFATVCSQSLAMLWVIHHFRNKGSFIHFDKTYRKLKKRIVLSIFSIGMSPFLMNACACAVVIIINNALRSYGGDLAIGAYGIVNRMLTLFVMIVIGVTQGMQPIIGYNYGARQFDRVRKTLKYGIIAGVTITTFGFVVSELFPHMIVAMFTTSNELTELATTGLRIACLMFPFVGCQIVISNFFQSIGHAKVSIFLSLSRQLLFLIPCLILLPRYWGTEGVWASMPMSDFVAFVVAIVALGVHFKKVRKQSLPVVTD